MSWLIVSLVSIVSIVELKRLVVAPASSVNNTVLPVTVMSIASSALAIFTVATVPSAVKPLPESVTLVRVTVRAVVLGSLLLVLLNTRLFSIVLTVPSSVPAWVMVTTGLDPALLTV